MVTISYWSVKRAMEGVEFMGIRLCEQKTRSVLG